MPRLRLRFRCQAALLLLAPLLCAARLSGSVPAGDVALTTDPSRVLGCTPLGSVRLPDPKALDAVRSEAARRGADVVRLTEVSARAVAGDLYRCGSGGSDEPRSVPAPLATASPVPTATPPSPTPALSPTPQTLAASAAPTPGRRSRRTTPAPPSTAERQRAAHEELEGLKAAIVVLSDPRDIEGCEKRGDRSAAGTTEDSLREAAVAALANVMLVRRGEDGSISGEYYRCPRVQYQRLLAVTPPPVR